MGSLLRSFRIQRRVIGALIMRETFTRFGRENLGFAWCSARF
jgi:capsular polysaccharide transport system permease protein